MASARDEGTWLYLPHLGEASRRIRNGNQYELHSEIKINLGYSKFKASLSYMKPYFKKQKQQQQKTQNNK